MRYNVKMKKEIIEKAIIKVNKKELKRRNMPMPVELTEIEHDFLLGLIEGRNHKELQAGIKLNNQRDSYNAVLYRLRKKLDALTLSHVVYKAVKLGLV